MLGGLIRSALIRALDRRGMEMVRQPSLASFLRSRGIDLVVDVGANTGQFGANLRRRGFAGRILSFEPVSGAFAALERQSSTDPLWDCRRCAVGAAFGEIDIHVSENSQFSSAKKSSALGSEFDQQIRTVATETVSVTTLDAALEGDPARAVFLKIDTQGFEREVLDGAPEALKRAQGLLLELPIEHLYQNVWSFSKAISVLGEHGFVPAQLRPVNSLHDDAASAVEFDCVFRRKR